LNNPLKYTDPTGWLLTDYYDENGIHLLHVNDGIDEAIVMNRMVFNALNEDDQLSNMLAKKLGGVSLGTNTDFEMIVATLYAEAGYINPVSAESAAIYDVMENRSNVFGKSVPDIIKGGGIYGYGSTDYNIALAKGEGYDANKYNLSRHNTARIGAMLGTVNPNNRLDFSQGAYFWDASVYLDYPQKYPNNYFNQEGHNTTIGTLSNRITFSYTTKVGATQFMKYNPTVFPNKTWP
jgi:hypothetical protein